MSTSPTCSHLKDKKVILVTGGNRGIGKAICKGLLQKHPNVHVLLGSRDLNKGKQAADEIKGQNKSLPSCSLTVVQLDVTSDSSVQAAAQMVERLGCKLYGIVNNAAVSPCTSTSCSNLLDTNYFGPGRINDAFSPILMRPGGRIVNVSSVGAPVYLSGCLFYFGAKGKRRELHSRLANPCGNGDGVEGLDRLAREALDLCKPTLGTFVGAPILRPKDHAYQLSKAFLNAYTVLHSLAEPDLIINSCCTGFVDTDLVPKRLGFTGTTEEGAVMPMELLVQDMYTKDNDGNFFIENKARKLAEIPDLKVYPKSFAKIFEKFRPQQLEERVQREKQMRRNKFFDSNSRCNTAVLSCFCVTLMCLFFRFMSSFPPSRVGTAL